MNSYITDLFVLQQLVLQKKPATSDREAAISQLRARVPAPIRAHCERLLAQGRKGVAMVNHGVCCECHIRVPSGTLASLANPQNDQIYLCESCGCYLRPDPDESREFAAHAEAGRKLHRLAVTA
jgi:predicted  nucleic acid-binding Zn-ribbon protein